MHDELALAVAIGHPIGNDIDRWWTCRSGDYGHWLYELSDVGLR